MPVSRPALPPHEEVCPVPEQTLGRLYSSPNRDLADILGTLPGLQRARLAVFCHARAHLRDMGLAIAATCDEADLVHVAGQLGLVLHTRSRKQVPQPTEHNARFGRRPISLAVLARENVPAMDDDESSMELPDHTNCSIVPSY
jgi:hypothetical protein